MTNVGDVHLLTLQAHSVDHVVEQLAAASNKRQSLRVFVGARALAHEQQPRVGVAIAEDDLVARLGKLAALAVADLFTNLGERQSAFTGYVRVSLRRCCDGAVWL